MTPGSLSVQPVLAINSTSLQVPQPSFNETNYGFLQNGGGEGVAVSGNKRLYKLAYNTASLAQPVSFSSRYQNETYHLNFSGPAVRCGPASESVVDRLTALHGISYAENRATFLSWVAGDEQQLDTSRITRVKNFQTLDYQSQDAARLFIMSNIGVWNKVMQVNVTECLLYNATYDVDFVFQYPQQSSYTVISKWLNSVAAPNSPFNYNPYSVTAAAITSYSSMMDAFGRLLVGTTFTDHYSIRTVYFTSWNIMAIDWSRAEAVQAGLEQLFQNFTLSLLSDEGLM